MINENEWLPMDVGGETSFKVFKARLTYGIARKLPCLYQVKDDNFLPVTIWLSCESRPTDIHQDHSTDPSQFDRTSVSNLLQLPLKTKKKKLRRRRRSPPYRLPPTTSPTFSSTTFFLCLEGQISIFVHLGGQYTIGIE